VKRPTWEQQKAIVEQWKRAGPELERIRREELRHWVYDWTIVDALLDMGDRFGRSRFPRGMVEMQSLFMRAARKQGLIPHAVREESATYGDGGVPPANRRHARNHDGTKRTGGGRRTETKTEGSGARVTASSRQNQPL
jgi:hypothetical protein